MGLSITTQLVNLMGGRIWVESELGKGSQFHFTVELALEATAGRPAAEARNLSQKRILLVDDNDVYRAQLQRQLSNWKAEIVSVADGGTALDELNRAAQSLRPFDLVMLDAVMPERDGIQTAEAIRAKPEFAALPLVLLTTATQRGIAERTQHLRIPARLTKPVFESELFRAIEQALGANQTAAEKTLPFETPIKHETPLRVLLVDDNAVNRQLGRRVLEKRGHTVVLGEDGRHALRLYRESRYDLVLMDVQMPGMNGFEATAEIRRIEAERGIRTPIIAMTAMAMIGDREACLAAGMDEYVTKPLRIEELMERIACVTTPEPVRDSIAPASRDYPGQHEQRSSSV